MRLGYEVNLERLCRNQSFKPSQVVSSELVFPKGAVPNAQLIWVRIELESGDRSFITLPLSEFHEYVKLPESSIGGWTDGDRGSDIFGLDPRYAIVNPGGDDEVQDELQHSTEITETDVA